MLKTNNKIPNEYFRMVMHYRNAYGKIGGLVEIEEEEELFRASITLYYFAGETIAFEGQRSYDYHVLLKSSIRALYRLFQEQDCEAIFMCSSSSGTYPTTE
jgi:hypothetical protein